MNWRCLLVGHKFGQPERAPDGKLVKCTVKCVRGDYEFNWAEAPKP